MDFYLVTEGRFLHNRKYSNMTAMTTTAAIIPPMIHKFTFLQGWCSSRSIGRRTRRHGGCRLLRDHSRCRRSCGGWSSYNGRRCGGSSCSCCDNRRCSSNRRLRRYIHHAEGSEMGNLGGNSVIDRIQLPPAQ